MKDPLSLTECPLSLLYHSIIFVLLIYTILFTNFLFRVLILLSYFNTPNISILGVRTRKYRMRGILLLFCVLGEGGSWHTYKKKITANIFSVLRTAIGSVTFATVILVYIQLC